MIFQERNMERFSSYQIVQSVENKQYVHYVYDSDIFQNLVYHVDFGKKMA